MFRESLLESSQSRKRKRWPVAAAFAGEIIIASLLVLIPLLTTAVIRVSAHVTRFVPLPTVRIANNNPPNTGSGVSSGGRTNRVVVLTNTAASRFIGRHSYEECCVDPPMIADGKGSNPDLPLSDHVMPRRQSATGPLRVSNLSEAQLLNKVEPVYPRIAVLAGRQGDVKLHAFIAKDGTIESLTVISGDPMLVPATLEAVRQWRYRPYILNGEPVEVETFITVSFKGIRN